MKIFTILFKKEQPPRGILRLVRQGLSAAFARSLWVSFIPLIQTSRLQYPPTMVRILPGGDFCFRYRQRSVECWSVTSRAPSKKSGPRQSENAVRPLHPVLPSPNMTVDRRRPQHRRWVRRSTHGQESSRVLRETDQSLGLLTGDMKFGFCVLAGNQFLGTCFLLFRIRYNNCVIVKAGVYNMNFLNAFIVPFSLLLIRCFSPSLKMAYLHKMLSLCHALFAKVVYIARVVHTSVLKV